MKMACVPCADSTNSTKKKHLKENPCFDCFFLLFLFFLFAHSLLFVPHLPHLPHSSIPSTHHTLIHNVHLSVHLRIRRRGSPWCVFVLSLALSRSYSCSPGSKLDLFRVVSLDASQAIINKHPAALTTCHLERSRLTIDYRSP